MKKTLLIDLSALNRLYNGFGQIAFNYGKYFEATYRREQSDYDITLLLPKKFFGTFGNEVRYLSSSNLLRRICPYMLPQTDVWHNLTHVSRFMPYSNKSKYIYTIHDLNGMLPDYEKTIKRVEKNSHRIHKQLDRANVVVAISNFVCEQIYQYLDLKGKPLKMIYNGVEQITDTPIQKPHEEIIEPFFFSIGVFRKRKNFQHLLDLMKLMPDKTLYLAGNNNTEYGKIIKERIANEGITNVHLLGLVSTEQKAWLYKNCKAFLFPSTFEGFGLPVIEAMQFGKPVFTMRETSLEEIGGDYAYFWDNLEPQTMKHLIDEQLMQFYANPALANAEKKYADTFSYQHHFAKYEELYRSLCFTDI